jgi:hypothetical protein
LRLHYEWITAIDVHSSNTAVVTLVATVNGHLMEPGVPLYASGVSITGLDGAVVYSSIADIVVPAGGATRDITVTVNWTLPEQARTGVPQLTQTYEMTVVDQQSGKWYVKEIRASTQPMGTP